MNTEEPTRRVGSPAGIHHSAAVTKGQSRAFSVPTLKQPGFTEASACPHPT